jgi:hypothetical protein
MALAECRHDAHHRPVCVACNAIERAWWPDECDDVDVEYTPLEQHVINALYHAVAEAAWDDIP